MDEPKSESDVQQHIQAEGPKYGCQLLRNNSGAFENAQGQWIRFGLGNVSKKHSDKIKSSDLIGFTKVTITPDMVGKVVAVFTAVEVKKPGWKLLGKTPEEKAQLAFIDWVFLQGGLAGIANSVESFRKILGV